jgi:hypothetical protein
MKPRKRSTRTRRKRPSRRPGEDAPAIDTMPLHLPPRTTLTGGDVDVDEQRARDVGEEAVGGSVATPDQDIVDKLGRALGVEQGLDDEVRTSGEILRERDRHRWTS